MSKKRLFISTGDVSADHHAANLVRKLQAENTELEIQAIGGVALKQTNIPLLATHEHMGVVGMGLITAAPYHWWLGQKIRAHLKEWKPDVVMLVDYGEFHLWLAGLLKQDGHRVVYFIPPQIWASRKNRIQKIKANIDHVFCIFPFEKALYEAEGIPVTYVGHPLVGTLPPVGERHTLAEAYGINTDFLWVGLLPGSRRMEVQHLLKPMIGTLGKLQQQLQKPVEGLLALAPSFSKEKMEEMMAPWVLEYEASVHVIRQKTHQIQSTVDLALVASGTATLETALYGTPQVLSYKAPWFTAEVARRVCYLPCLGLPNILCDMDNPIVPECLQERASADIMTQAALPLLDPTSPETRHQQWGYQKIQHELGHLSAIEEMARILQNNWLS